MGPTPTSIENEESQIRKVDLVIKQLIENDTLQPLPEKTIRQLIQFIYKSEN